MLLQRIEGYSKKHHLITEETTVILGLSGGPDSVFLLHLLSQWKAEKKIKNVIAVHLNHQWRSNSHEDVEFCRTLAQQHAIPFVSTTLAELNLFLRSNGSKEELGRRARRHFFNKIRAEYNADVIALAHHADDQQETFFIRLLRGASLSGLTAMKPHHGHYIRPLLEVHKHEMLDYLHEHNIAYLTDPSNESSEFLRNRIRAQVIPALRSCDERFDASFARTLHALQETEDFLQEFTKAKFAEIAVRKEDVYFLNVADLLKQHPALLHRLLVHWFCQATVPFPVSKGFFAEVTRFLRNPGDSTHQTHEKWSLVKKDGMVFIYIHQDIEHPT